MGVMRRFGVGIGFAHHHELAALHRGFDAFEVRHADQWVRGSHPPEIDLPPFHRFHLFPCVQSWLGCDRSRGKPPRFLNRMAVVRIGDQPVARKQMGESAGFASTHGIRLTRE